MNEEDFYKEACRRKLKEMRKNDLNSSTSNLPLRAQHSTEHLPNDQIRIYIERIQYCLKYHQYDRFISLMQQLSFPVLLGLLPYLPYNQLYESIPQTLLVLDIIFSRILQAPSINKSPWQILQLDLLIPKLILIFANGLRPTIKGEKNCNSYFPTCRNLLLSVFALDSSLPTRLNSSRDTVKNCIDQLAGHSLVECKDNSLKSLPVALQTEITADIQQKKQALQKLNDFCGKMSTTIPSESSHQRLLQVNFKVFIHLFAFHIALLLLKKV